MPPDEAAAIMVEQLREAMGRGLITAPETDPRFKPFVAVSICRADMINHFTNQEIARFDDKDMRKLAALMGDWYRDESFWHDLKTIGGIILEEKEQGRGSTFGSG